MANVGGATHVCFICREEGYSAYGSVGSIYWLCKKHDNEMLKEEKILKEMIEMQALRNIKRRFLEGAVV